MSTPYIGEIRLVGFTFAPVDWAFCQGQLLSISQNEELFNLLGTTYGGDGINTFGLPDLRGRTPVHHGTPAGGPSYVQGETGGVESVTVLATQLPIHTHTIPAQAGAGNSDTPIGGVFAGTSAGMYAAIAAENGVSGPILAATGGSEPHSNLQPYLCMNYIIALYGVYPSQS